MSATTAAPPAAGTVDVAQLAAQLRVDAIRCTTAAGSGHPTSALSAADVVAVLLARHLRADWQRPGDARSDVLVFSKGHAAALLYAALRAVGAIDEEELLTYRSHGSRLQGHPTPALPWVPVATGSLGLGLPMAAGIALGARLERLPAHVWVLCGDGEMAEGSMWEALERAEGWGLGNLTAIVDCNGLGQTGAVASDPQRLERRVAAFGCEPIPVDGHDHAAVDAALARARATPLPAVVLARTVKGEGVPAMAGAEGWHGRALPPEVAREAVDRLGGVRSLRVTGPPPSPPRGEGPPAPPATRATPPAPRYAVGDAVAPRDAFGAALRAAGARPDVIVVDGDVNTATRTDGFAAAYPDRFVQAHIAEQAMVAAAAGLATRGWRPVVATFGAFLTRAHDVIRMAALSDVAMTLVGSHPGTEIGRDGGSQMALEDLAMMRAIDGSTVVSPADGNATSALLTTLLDRGGIGYLRSTRGAYPVLYPPDEAFPLGACKHPVRHGDDVTLAGTGATVHHAIAAAHALRARGIGARVLDVYSLAPLDGDAVAEAVAATGGRLVIVEDHRPEGGLAGAVLEALAPSGLCLRVARLAVAGRPGSGAPGEVMEAMGIGPLAIAAAAEALLEREGR